MRTVSVTSALSPDQSDHRDLLVHMSDHFKRRRDSRAELPVGQCKSDDSYPEFFTTSEQHGRRHGRQDWPRWKLWERQRAKNRYLVDMMSPEGREGPNLTQAWEIPLTFVIPENRCLALPDKQLSTHGHPKLQQQPQKGEPKRQQEECSRKMLQEKGPETSAFGEDVQSAAAAAALKKLAQNWQKPRGRPDVARDDVLTTPGGLWSPDQTTRGQLGQNMNNNGNGTPGSPWGLPPGLMNECLGDPCPLQAGQIDMLLCMAISSGTSTDVITECKRALLASGVNNVLLNYLTALKYQLYDVLDRLLDKIRRNFLCIAQSEQFLTLPVEYLLIFLEDNCIKVENELDIFFVALAWIDYNKQERLPHAGKVLNRIRFVYIEPEDIIKYVEPNTHLFTGEEGSQALLNVYRHRALIASGLVPPPPVGEVFFKLGKSPRETGEDSDERVTFQESTNTSNSTSPSADSCAAPISYPQSRTSSSSQRKTSRGQLRSRASLASNSSKRRESTESFGRRLAEDSEGPGNQRQSFQPQTPTVTPKNAPNGDSTADQEAKLSEGRKSSAIETGERTGDRPAARKRPPSDQISRRPRFSVMSESDHEDSNGKPPDIKRSSLDHTERRQSQNRTGSVSKELQTNGLTREVVEKDERTKDIGRRSSQMSKSGNGGDRQRIKDSEKTKDEDSQTGPSRSSSQMTKSGSGGDKEKREKGEKTKDEETQTGPTQRISEISKSGSGRVKENTEKGEKTKDEETQTGPSRRSSQMSKSDSGRDKEKAEKGEKTKDEENPTGPSRQSIKNSEKSKDEASQTGLSRRSSQMSKSGSGGDKEKTENGETKDDENPTDPRRRSSRMSKSGSGGDKEKTENVETKDDENPTDPRRRSSRMSKSGSGGDKEKTENGEIKDDENPTDPRRRSSLMSKSGSGGDKEKTENVEIKDDENPTGPRRRSSRMSKSGSGGDRENAGKAKRSSQKETDGPSQIEEREGREKSQNGHRSLPTSPAYHLSSGQPVQSVRQTGDRNTSQQSTWTHPQQHCTQDSSSNHFPKDRSPHHSPHHLRNDHIHRHLGSDHSPQHFRNDHCLQHSRLDHHSQQLRTDRPSQQFENAHPRQKTRITPHQHQITSDHTVYHVKTDHCAKLCGKPETATAEKDPLHHAESPEDIPRFFRVDGGSKIIVNGRLIR